MYGLVIESIVGYIRKKYGDDKWMEIRRVGKIEQHSFSTHLIYPETTIPRLVQTASDLLGVSREEFLTELGTFFVTFVSQYGYDKILRVLGRHMRDFLNGLDNLHEYMRFSYPKLKPPSFFVEKETEHGLMLHYRSKRRYGGYVRYVMGQIKSVGEAFYGLDIDLEVIKEEFVGNMVHVTMQLRFDNSAFLTERTASQDILDEMPIESELFFEAFPFHIVFTEDMIIKSAGLGLANVMPSIEGHDISHMFILRRPMVEFAWEQVLSHTNNVFELESFDSIHKKENSNFSEEFSEFNFSRKDSLGALSETSETMPSDGMKLHLRGQMIFTPEWQAILFLGTPVLPHLTAMFDTGLFINDLSLHDNSRDLVLAGTQTSAELKLALDQEQVKSKKLEDNMKKLDEEMRRTDELLYQMIPRQIADRLRAGEPALDTCQVFDHVTILFSDVVGFTMICSRISPLQVVNMLNSMYSKFDHLCAIHETYKVETIGDAYVVVSGAPEEVSDHAERIADMALGMISIMETLVDPSTGNYLQIRVGINSGVVVAGVVGLKMPRYCLFGDTVNTAAKMESSSEHMKIQMTQATMEFLKSNSKYIVTERGLVNVKDKGKMYTYWLSASESYEPRVKIEVKERVSSRKPIGRVVQSGHRTTTSTDSLMGALHSSSVSVSGEDLVNGLSNDVLKTTLKASNKNGTTWANDLPSHPSSIVSHASRKVNGHDVTNPISIYDSKLDSSRKISKDSIPLGHVTPSSNENSDATIHTSWRPARDRNLSEKRTAEVDFSDGLTQPAAKKGTSESRRNSASPSKTSTLIGMSESQKTAANISSKSPLLDTINQGLLMSTSSESRRSSGGLLNKPPLIHTKNNELRSPIPFDSRRSSMNLLSTSPMTNTENHEPESSIPSESRRRSSNLSNNSAMTKTENHELSSPIPSEYQRRSSNFSTTSLTDFVKPEILESRRSSAGLSSQSQIVHAKKEGEKLPFSSESRSNFTTISRKPPMVDVTTQELASSIRPSAQLSVASKPSDPGENRSSSRGKGQRHSSINDDIQTGKVRLTPSVSSLSDCDGAIGDSGSETCSLSRSDSLENLKIPDSKEQKSTNIEKEPIFTIRAEDLVVRQKPPQVMAARRPVKAELPVDIPLGPVTLHRSVLLPSFLSALPSQVQRNRRNFQNSSRRMSQDTGQPSIVTPAITISFDDSRVNRVQKQREIAAYRNDSVVAEPQKTQEKILPKTPLDPLLSRKPKTSPSTKAIRNQAVREKLAQTTLPRKVTEVTIAGTPSSPEKTPGSGICSSPMNSPVHGITPSQKSVTVPFKKPETSLLGQRKEVMVTERSTREAVSSEETLLATGDSPEVTTKDPGKIRNSRSIGPQLITKMTVENGKNLVNGSKDVLCHGEAEVKKQVLTSATANGAITRSCTCTVS